MLAIEGKVHCLLSLKSCIFIVVGTSLSLYHYTLAAWVTCQFLVADAVSVLPVVAPVVYSLERNLVQRGEPIVKTE